MKFYNDDYISMQKRWERCRAAAAGEDEVHAGGEKWLPMLSLETQEDYKKRLHDTILQCQLAHHDRFARADV